MKILTTRVHLSRHLTLATFIVQGFVLIMIAPLQVDPHHDGIILGSAIGFSTGHFGPAGAFSQYGPLSPLIQGLFLMLFGNSLINLRLFAAINALIISFLLFRLLSKLASGKNALLVSSSWVLTSAIWSSTFPGALLPWPSLISTALILGAMNVLLTFLRKENGGSNLSAFKLFTAGLMLGMTGFARQQTWLACIFVLAILLVYFKRLTKEIYWFVLGISLALIGMFSWLASIRSIESYVNQVIIWPLSAYSTLGTNNNYNRYQFASYLAQSLVFIIALYLVALTRKRLESKVLGYAIILSLSALTILNGFWIAEQTEWNATVRVVLGEPQEKLLMSLSYFSCLSSIVMCALYLWKIRTLSRGQVEKFSIAVLGLVGVVQLYPQPDVLHLWWVAPIFLPSGWLALEWISRKAKLIEIKDGVVLVTIFSILGLVLAIKFIAQPWTEFTIPVLKGTYSFESKATAIDTFTSVQKYIKKGDTSFDCPDGVFAVSDGNYNAPDEWFVNLGMLKSENLNLGKTRIICYKDEKFVDSEAKRLGMEVEQYVVSKDQTVSFAVLVRK